MASNRNMNSDIRKRYGFNEDVVTRVEKGLLRWFGHLERMNESRQAKPICRANVFVEKVGKSRSRKSYADQINDTLKSKKDTLNTKPTSLHEKIEESNWERSNTKMMRRSPNACARGQISTSGVARRCADGDGAATSRVSPVVICVVGRRGNPVFRPNSRLMVNGRMFWKKNHPLYE
ncbi:hypothetical protein EVAR_38604_1 [Eumeta japonica]|uniref:Uncharacterized protein n=1 Tax=Eumeta variegata TaxID=151549 RepID=A0A4C1WQT1_EUMVA|nr:hypothetical protein EVAR_38604_1 [Eumeta japonica]